MVGAFVPTALDRIGIDPAAVTGVFITTSNDVLGVLVLFYPGDAVASSLLYCSGRGANSVEVRIAIEILSVRPC